MIWLEQNIVTLDIETENTGADILNDNKRIISIQILKEHDAKIFYDGSNTNSIKVGKNELISLVENGKSFVGFNLRNFDIPLIQKFLDVKIPSSQIIEISELPAMDEVRRKLGKNKVSLVQTCDVIGVECKHKNIMNEKSEALKKETHVIEQAKIAAKKWVDDLGWGREFSYNHALNKIAGGMAILESFNEFVKSGGREDTLFYKYAIGDIIVEHELYQNLKKGF